MISNITEITEDAQDWSPLPPLCWVWLSSLSCLPAFSFYLNTRKWCLSTSSSLTTYLATCLTWLITCQSSVACFTRFTCWFTTNSKSLT